MPSKPWWHSKTVWFNASLLLFTFLVDLPEELRQLGADDDTAVRVATIGNMGLRFLSTARIAFSASGN